MDKPKFNHTRADGPYDPCPICLALMTKKQIAALVKDMNDSQTP